MILSKLDVIFGTFLLPLIVVSAVAYIRKSRGLYISSGVDVFVALISFDIVSIVSSPVLMDFASPIVAEHFLLWIVYLLLVELAGLSFALRVESRGLLKHCFDTLKSAGISVSPRPPEVPLKRRILGLLVHCTSWMLIVFTMGLNILTYTF